MTENLPPSTPLRPGKTDPMFKFFMWVCCGVPVFGAAAIALILAISSAAGGDADHSIDAQMACEALVKDQLKSPATADFTTEVDGDGPYSVSGTVDSENSFGAGVQTAFRCAVDSSGSTATLESMG